MGTDPSAAPLKTVPLDSFHRHHGAKMVPFAGYEMPVQYKAGIMTEHTHTRTKAGLFDVSHMGQAWLHGKGAAKALERLVPGDIQGLSPALQAQMVGAAFLRSVVPDKREAIPKPGGLGLVSSLCIAIFAVVIIALFVYIASQTGLLLTVWRRLH